VVTGIKLASTVAPTTAAVLMLLPLSAFEATVPLPAAAVQLTRSRIAARRLLDLTPPDAVVSATSAPSKVPVQRPHCSSTGRLVATDLRAGHSTASASAPMTIELPPGGRLAITGPSGSGKTALLMTLAGLLPALHGQVVLDAIAIDALNEEEIRAAVCYFAEDAHIFATTIRDNLLVARGDCQDDELMAALDQVGLGRWLADLPDGLGTVLPAGAQTISAGQRRRLLLARALISPARIVLLDEPTEHLDAADAQPMLRELLDSGGGLISGDRTVVVASHHLPDDIGTCQVIAVGYTY
jgi:ATP-binding cassette, subfamily C, bacterial CydC